MAIEIEMTCKACNAVYTPTRADLMKGPAVYRYCPACRAAATAPADRAAAA